MRRLVPLLAGFLAAVNPPAIQAQASAWVTRLGTDTVALEKFVRTKDRLEGDLVTMSPRVRMTHYLVRLDPTGAVTSYEISSKPAVEAPGSQPSLTGVVTFGGSGIEAVVRRGEKTDTTRLPATNVVPSAFLSWGLLGLATEAALRGGGDSGAVNQYSAGAPRVTPASVMKRGDSLAVDFFGSPIMVKTDRAGRIVGVNGSRTTVKVLGILVSDLDLAAAAEPFVARERSGHAAGVLSVRDTVRAAVGGADLTVDYGRPSKRGREIWGSVVPYDAVWRTGANAATQFTTSKPLDLGGLSLPAGSYTLWSVPTATGVTLIVNKQTGQWGTNYDPKQDLGRVEAKIDRLDQPVERFTISVVPSGDAGALQFEWDRLRYSVPFKVKG
jgi:hypothetical protein